MKKKDKFGEALEKLRKTLPEISISPQAHAALNANREAVKNGTAKSIPLKEGLRRLEARMKREGIEIKDYDPNDVSSSDAAEIKKLLEQDAKGELKYKKIGTAKVKPPKRKPKGK